MRPQDLVILSLTLAAMAITDKITYHYYAAMAAGAIVLLLAALATSWLRVAMAHARRTAWSQPPQEPHRDLVRR